MGRTRPSAQPSKPVPGKITVNHSDALPLSFIEYIQALPLDESTLPEPPPKRRRLDADHAFGSMLVAEGNIKIVKSRAARTLVESGERHCAGNHLSISWMTSEEYTGTLDQPPASTAKYLRIRSTNARKATALDISIKTGNENLDDAALRIFRVTNTLHALKSKDEGAFWTSIGFRFRRSGSQTIFDIGLKVYWNETLSPAGKLRSSLERGSSEAMISEFYPQPASSENGSGDSWSPMDFYEAAHVPNKEDKDALAIRVPELTSELYPYQRRTLQWLLHREGVKWSATDDGAPVISKIFSAPTTRGDGSFREVRDLSGNQFYVSDLYQVVTKDPSPFIETESHLKGGILAEEMGLGKTLEIIGLILLHTREDGERDISNLGDNSLKPTGATLIVAPESLRRQWLAELERHAPYLRVKFYSGCGKSKASSETEEKELVEELISQDVVVTTYSVLTSELHFAEEPPDRDMRHARRHHRPRSPLVQISWWRVCLDEAQMIENGLSNAASVARLIPRVNAWGVTGTPVKSDVGDLLGLLQFLRYEPYASRSQVWQALVTRHKLLFRDLFSRISLRHTKRMVRDEISLPPQKRLVITVPFTAVEETFYQDIFKEMAEACGLDVNGIPLRDDWDPDAVEETMRKWLNRLRRTALHPQVGVQRYRGLGQKAGPIRTVDEVLDVMIEQSEAGIRNQQRAIFSGKLTMGQLLENGPRVKEALRIWTEVKEEIDDIVAECRRNLKEAIDEARRSQGTAAGQRVMDDDTTSDEDAEEFSSSTRIGEFRRRLRLSLEIQHRAVFFCANAYFQIRENKDLTQPESDEFKELQKKEEDSYDRAKTIRREILREAHRKATKYMNMLSQRAATQSFSSIPELVPHPQKGIESRPIIERLEELQLALNDQANKLDEWREHVIQLLTKPLVDEEDDVEVTGEEYTDSTQIQEELMVYVEALRAGIADRQDALSGQANELIRHEVKTARQQARNEEGHAPELRLKLLDERDQVKPPLELGSFRGAISELRAINARQHRDNAGPSRAAMENAIIAQQMKSTQAQLAAQDKSSKAMELEIDLFTSAMNARLEYYRQLQAISDSVAPYEGASNEQVITSLVESENSLRRTLELSESKHRYLINLKESGSKSNEPRLCVICQSTFTIGVLTVCGHQFCKECIMLWFKTHHNCPMCKRPLRSSNLHDITLKPQDARLHAESSPTVVPEAQKRTSPKNTAIYTEFSQEKLAEIQDIELRPPGFTTKVDAIVRHILWLRESDPGAKSIIFSQYRDFLNVLSMAFDRHHIGHSAIDKPNGITKFKEDPSTECFLLHARAHSSGLNLVDASHVFLCEHILNTALELQAIARVDRIGQQHETTVWLYIVQGTVEESIYNLSVQRRMEHMGRQDKGKSKESTPELLDASIEAANTLEMQQASLSKLMSKDRTAGEMVDGNDLWQCLFGHVSQSQLRAGRDGRLEDSTVVGFLSGEAAEERRRAVAAGGGSGEH